LISKGWNRSKGCAKIPDMEPANDNDIFGGKSPFKGFRKEAVDWEPMDGTENVIELWAETP
jgi:hypothetical protein